MLNSTNARVNHSFGWRCIDVEKINLPSLYQFGANLRPVTSINVNTVSWTDLYLWAIRTKPTLEDLFNNFPTLDLCKKPGLELLAEVDYWADLTKAPAAADPKTGKLSVSDQTKAQQLATKAAEFEIVLVVELDRLAAYQVSQKGIYIMSGLIEHADEALPESVRAKLNDSIIGEIRRSGRCVAFENPTAAGFHTMRAVEATIHKYYVSVCQPPNKKKLNSWGAYIAALRKATADDVEDVEDDVKDDVKRVVAILQEIKDQDRNLIMHPEAVLTNDDAFTQFESGKHAIIAMAGRL